MFGSMNMLYFMLLALFLFHFSEGVNFQDNDTVCDEVSPTIWNCTGSSFSQLLNLPENATELHWQTITDIVNLSDANFTHLSNLIVLKVCIIFLCRFDYMIKK